MNFRCTLTIASIILFLVIILTLQIVQSDYNPAHQFMSELALGKHGDFMFFAFFSLSLAVFISQLSLSQHQQTTPIRLLLVIASFSLLGAGIFRLDTFTTPHITLVAIAFILIVLSMYLLPRISTSFKNKHSSIVCWGLAISTAFSVALGYSILPVGISQRLSASFILIWLVWLALFSNKWEGSAK